MGSRQETRGGMGYRCRPRSATGHAPHRDERSTLGLCPRIQFAQGHPTAIVGSCDGASPSCVNVHSQRCSMSSLQSETETGKIIIFKEE
jgi:hypothetical protein